MEKEDGRMAKAATNTVFSIAKPTRRAACLVGWGFPGEVTEAFSVFIAGAGPLIRVRAIVRSGISLAVLVVMALATAPGTLRAQTDCLSCHADKDMQDSSGHSIAVDGQKFKASIHGSLKCNDCHADIKQYPHPDHVAPVQCKSCHTGQESDLESSVHASAAQHPCTSCHGDAHSIFLKDNAKSAVYPLNIPRTCGSCHGSDAMAKKHGLPNVYPLYVDSIHGFALTKGGLLVAANCTSCHGSHRILSRKDPQSPTFKTNISAMCGSCHAGITVDYEGGVHGKALAGGKTGAPVCTDCHTAHAILQPTEAAFRTQSTPICGSCHKAEFSTYRDTFHSQLGALGGYVETARCWDCHGAHRILPPSDPQSPIAPTNLVKTCGRCHAGANLSFVQYQPHANARDRKLNPALYFIRLFMNLLLAGVLTFFVIHTILWLIRARYDQIKKRSAEGGKDA
jgi:predicted CXXCH cytochrome family protein